MRAGIAAFAGGVILLYCVGEIPPLVLLWIALIAGITLSFLSQRLRTLSICFSCLVLGLLWASWSASERLEDQLPDQSQLPSQTVEGYRCSLVAPGAYNSSRFDFCVVRWVENDPEVERVEKLRLALYGAEPGAVLPLRMRLAVRLKPPHGSVNPQGFRYETWLFRHGFGATGSVREWTPAPDIACGPGCRYHQWRESVAAKLSERYGQLEAYPLMEALLLGERRLLDAEDWALFQATGTSHLIAISGLHIGLIGLFSGWVAKRLIGRLGQRYVGARAQRWSVAAASLLACLGYALLAGFTVPTQRALVMATVVMGVYLSGRLSGYWTGWLVALGSVLLLDPFAPLDGGFWLSFGAVGCLILMFSGRLQPTGFVHALLQAQVAVMAGLLPILAFMDLPSAALGWLVNILAIPLMSFVLMPLLFTLTPLGMLSQTALEFCAPILEAVLGGFMWALQGFADVSPEGFRFDAFAAVVMALAVTACLLPTRRASRAAFAAVAIISMGGSLARSPQNASVAHPELWVWDVGQGLSALYREGDQVLVYDTGPGSPSGYTSVDAVIGPNFRQLGIGVIDTLVISHGDADHASGLSSLLRHYPVRYFVTGEPERVAGKLKASAITLDACKSGEQIRFGESRLAFWQAPASAPGNGRSCVLRITTDHAEIILPGDITAAQEQLWLAEHDVPTGKPRIVVAPHHGSKTSSSTAWVNDLKPDVVIFSAGYRHPYGHPARSVSARYRAAGAALFNTASAGAIRVRLRDKAVDVVPARAGAPFWIAAPPAQSSGRP
ncbi:DNA internalization-related competence protein ComEC/Rec2 [Marinobacter fonticola]|uniref:DNA internalization-related competence protein ComEC/Rec2 n=1 Tax=Marinobacter fonticola TaxID=2603215 RepID=UPI00143CE34A|nr:DNA internalization-related competence protein ComEC/Rec2 [Marinobacter fonticola]